MRNVTPGTVNVGLWLLPILLVGCMILAFDSYFTVSAGNVAVKLRFGELVGAYGEGIHWKIPFVDSVEKFSVRIKKDAFRTEAFSKDLQQVNLALAVNHRIMPNTVESIYRNLGPEYTDTVLKPMVEEWSKAVIAKYSADSLISNRMQVTRELDEILKKKMAEKEVIVSDIAITDFDFSPQFLSGRGKTKCRARSQTRYQLGRKSKKRSGTKNLAGRSRSQIVTLAARSSFRQLNQTAPSGSATARH